MKWVLPCIFLVIIATGVVCIAISAPPENPLPLPEISDAPVVALAGATVVAAPKMDLAPSPELAFLIVTLADADLPGELFVPALLNPELAALPEIDLSDVDAEAWLAVASVFAIKPAREPWRRTGIDAARVALKARIAREGYTPENLARAQEIMQRTKP